MALNDRDLKVLADGLIKRVVEENIVLTTDTVDKFLLSENMIRVYYEQKVLSDFQFKKLKRNAIVCYKSEKFQATNMNMSLGLRDVLMRLIEISEKITSIFGVLSKF